MKKCHCRGEGFLLNGVTGDWQRCRCNPPLMEYNMIFVPEDPQQQEQEQSDLFSCIANSLCSAVYFCDQEQRSR